MLEKVTRVFKKSKYIAVWQWLTNDATFDLTHFWVEIWLPLSKRFDLEISNDYIQIPWVSIHREWSRGILIWLYRSRGECRLHVEWGCCLRSYRQTRKIAGNPWKSIHIFGTIYLRNSQLVSFDSEIICTFQQIHPQARKVCQNFDNFEIHRHFWTSSPWDLNSAFGPDLAGIGCSDVWRPRSPVIVWFIFQLTDHLHAQPDKSLITFASKWSCDRTGQDIWPIHFSGPGHFDLLHF